MGCIVQATNQVAPEGIWGAAGMLWGSQVGRASEWAPGGNHPTAIMATITVASTATALNVQTSHPGSDPQSHLKPAATATEMIGMPPEAHKGPHGKVPAGAMGRRPERGRRGCRDVRMC